MMLRDPRPFIKLQVNGRKIRALIDSGSEVTVMNELLLTPDMKAALRPTNIRLYGANGSPIEVKGEVNMTFTLGKHWRFQFPVLIAKNTNSCLILGADLLREKNLVLDCARNRLCRRSKEQFVTAGEMSTLCKHGEKLVSIKTPYINETVLFSPREGDSTFVPCLVKTNDKGRAKVLWQNGSPWDLQVARNQVVGMVARHNPLDEHDNSLSFRMNEVSAKESLAKQVPLAHISLPLRSSYEQLLSEYVDVFSVNPNDIGRCDVLPQVITLKDPSKISCIPPYRTPQNLQPVVRDYVDNLLKAGVIQSSTSPFCSPLLLVRKANADSSKPIVEQFRVVHDYRDLNSNTVRDAYPLHNLYDLIDKVAASKVWSVIDLSSGFWNQVLDPKSSAYTAFSVPGKGHFEYTRSAQGLCNSPASFQRMLDFIVRGIPNVYVYIDDIVIASGSHQEHLATLSEVLNRFRKYHLKCRPHKLQIATAEINYLGYNLSHTNGIRPGVMKTAAVANWTEPTSVKEIRQFLGLCSFFRRTIPGFAMIAAPLTRLTRKDAAWKGGPLPNDAQASFLKLKQSLVSRPSVQAPDFALPFILTVDASTKGLGAILSQRQEGIEHPIAYASRTLNDSETKNAPFHLEYMAMAWACKHFKPYLLGRRFTLRTDHKPLQSLNKVKGAAFDRCLLELSNYDFEVEYIKGALNAADGLSRQTDEMQLLDLKRAINYSWSQIRSAQQSDPEIKALAVSLLYGKRAGSERLLSFITENEKNAMMLDGVVVTKDNKAFVPRGMRQSLLNVAHSFPAAGHYNHVKTLHRLKQYWYWPTMDDDVRLHCKGCPTCQVNSPSNVPSFPLQKLPVAVKFNSRVHMDLLGPLPDNEGDKYVMVLVDAYSKYLQLVSLPNKSMEQVSQAFYDHWLSVFGIPNRLISDQGKEFVNSCFHFLEKQFGFVHRTTSPYHPMSNGQAETSVKEVLRYARRYVNENNDWKPLLSNVRFAHNTAFNSTTKCTPYEAAFGIPPLLPGALISGAQPSPNYRPDALAEKVHYLKWLRHHILESSTAAYESWKRQHDRKAKHRHLEVGDKVFLRNQQGPLAQFHKFRDSFVGPFIIIKVFDKGMVEIVPVDPLKSKRSRLVHVNNVKLADATLQLYEQPLSKEEAQLPEVQAEQEKTKEQSVASPIEDAPKTRSKQKMNDRESTQDASEEEYVTPTESDHSDEETEDGSSSDVTSSSESENEGPKPREETADAASEDPVSARLRSRRTQPLPPDVLSTYLPLRQARRK